MRAGDLDRRVRVEAKRVRKGETNEDVEEWHFVCDRWMGRRDMRAAERFTGAETVAEVETVFKARHDSAMAEVKPDTHRLVLRGQVFAILGITELGRADAVELACAARGEAKYAEQDV